MNVVPNRTIPLLNPDNGAPETRALVGSKAPSIRKEAADASAAFKSVRSDNANAVSYPGSDTKSTPPREGQPICYYPLKPSDDAARGTGDHYKGRALRSTAGYERLVDAIMRKSNAAPARNSVSKQDAETAVDKMDIKRGTILRAPCHDGHTEAERFVHDDGKPSEAAGSGGRQRRSAEPEPDITICPMPSGWKHFVNIVAPVLGALVDYSTGSTGTPNATHPNYAAANKTDPCADTDR